MKAKIRKSLRDLGFSENEIQVYMSLTQLGESTAAKIAKKSGLPRTTVIGILEKLKHEGHLSSFRYKHSTYFWIESPKTIQNVFLNRAKIAEGLNEFLSEMYRSEADFPGAQIFDTKAGIKSFIEKTMINLEKKSVVLTIDTPSAGHYTKIFSDDFYNDLLSLKKKNNVATRTLVPFGSFSSIDPHKLKIQSISIREMPPEINFKASLWIIKDTTVFFSGRYPFVVVIKHKLITESIKTIFEYLWSVSQKKN